MDRNRSAREVAGDRRVILTSQAARCPDCSVVSFEQHPMKSGPFASYPSDRHARVYRLVMKDAVDAEPWAFWYLFHRDGTTETVLAPKPCRCPTPKYRWIRTPRPGKNYDLQEGLEVW
jgi:hypothetical protein